MYNVNLIKKTFENQMQKKVNSIHRFENVTNNQVFKIEADSRFYIFKIYSKRDWPEDGKLPFVYKKLDELNIPHAKLFVFNRKDENFSGGYLIEECLPGVTADRLALSGREAAALFERLAALASKVHTIELTNYGYTGGGNPALWTTFSEYMYDTLNSNSAGLICNGFIKAEELKRINTAIFKRLKHCDIFPSVLCHGDLSAKNILVNSKEIALIDWDDVQSLCWLADIARLTFWMRMTYSRHAADEYRKAFLDAYETQYDKKVFFEMEDTLHVWYGLDYLTFFTEGAVCEKVKTLLQDSLNKSGLLSN